jgi:hypothetical protein
MFCDFLAWRAGTTRPGQCRKKTAHISWPAGCSSSLSYYTRRRHHLQRRAPARAEKSQLLWTLPGQNSKKMLHWTCKIILHAPIFCQRLYFVAAHILSMPIFIRCIYFVDAYILLLHIFCPRLYFVVAYILSTPIFCCRIYFVDAFLFCRIYFVDGYLLSTPIFCQRQ